MKNLKTKTVSILQLAVISFALFGIGYLLFKYEKMREENEELKQEAVFCNKMKECLIHQVILNQDR